MSITHCSMLGYSRDELLRMSISDLQENCGTARRQDLGKIGTRQRSQVLILHIQELRKCKK